MKVGVVVFPGTNCDRDALHGVELAGGEPDRPVARGRPTCTAPRSVILPGGFAYGDYLRAGAIAALQPGHAARSATTPRAAGSCSASATASRS